MKMSLLRDCLRSNLYVYKAFLYRRVRVNLVALAPGGITNVFFGNFYAELKTSPFGSGNDTKQLPL